MELPNSWRLLRTAPADGTWNMACDLALMASARSDGIGVLRVYEWSVPTVSFGRHERTSGIYSAASIAALGLAAVRRPTGGRALLHSREVTYSVAMPMGDAWRWTAAYERVNALLLNAMLALKIPARIVDHARASAVRGPRHSENAPLQTAMQEAALDELQPVTNPHGESHVCFSGIAAGEIAVGKRKLVASSVWRERGAYLQHGSIMIHDDQRRLVPLLSPGATWPEPGAVLSEWLPPSDSPEATANLVESALHNAFRDCGIVVPWSIPTEVLRDVEAVQTRLAKHAWLWRR